MSIAQLFKRTFSAKKISQKEFAKLVGYSGASGVYNVLSRGHILSDTIEAWADALGCDVALIDRETGEIYK